MSFVAEAAQLFRYSSATEKKTHVYAIVAMQRLQETCYTLLHEVQMNCCVLISLSSSVSCFFISNIENDKLILLLCICSVHSSWPVAYRLYYVHTFFFYVLQVTC